MAESFRRPVAIQVDPIEKKPLAHYMPGTAVLSVGTFGCNLGCRFCQNASLSRGAYGKVTEEEVPPEHLVAAARRYGCRSIAFTYNEPTVCIEYVLETFILARRSGLGTVLVSNGFISAPAREELYPLVDAANIDVKGGDRFYRGLCDGEAAAVHASCEFFRNSCRGHLEITNLVIPGFNDAPEEVDELLTWVAGKLGLDTPLHFSAYFPAGGFDSAPPTPPPTLFRIRRAALERGFRHVHLGNLRA